MSKIFGVVPARMGSSRFPGKPLFPILGKPMIEHVYLRAKMYAHWDKLVVATCDEEILTFAGSKKWEAVMTSASHERCLDRVAEAIEKTERNVREDDIVVCVQGDEPMLQPNMIDAVLKPLQNDPKVRGTVLAMNIEDENLFKNPDTVKIIHNISGDVLYTSRSPIPFCRSFSKQIGAKRIYGIFAFRWEFLKLFNSLPASPLEQLESCDSNRICDNGLKQRIAPYPCVPSFSVDSPSDIQLVESALPSDVLWGKY